MLLLELYNARYEQSLQSGAVDSADQLNEYIPRRKDANYAEFAPGTQVTHSLLGPRVGTVVDVLAIPREDRRESGIPVQVGDRIYWMAPQGLTPIKGMAEGETKYDAAWDEKVKRLGQMAKQGPRKTVWDPVRRVYKTVPVNTAKPTQENIFSLTEKNSTTQTAQSVNEDSSTSSAAAEQAILNRIMTAHIDLLRQFGPEKVMQAAEQVAYNVGDLAEIGTSNVSRWVRQVRQILGA
jgi:hypothetical protein